MKRLFGYCLFSLILPLQAMAAPVSPLEALERLRKGFADMQDFTAEITQEKHLVVMRKKLVSTGVVRFKKPELFYMELRPPHASRMVLRDSTIELYFPQEKSRQQMALPADEGLKRWLSLLARPITALPEGLDVKADRSGDIQSVTISSRKAGQVRTFVITSGSDGRPRRLVIEERNGNRTAITFQKLRPNVGLQDKDFRVEQ
jgi:outer membrane lipoprotein carrier protein